MPEQVKMIRAIPKKIWQEKLPPKGGSDEVVKAIEAKSDSGNSSTFERSWKERYEKERIASLRGLAARMAAKGSQAKPGSAQSIIDSIKQQNKGLGQLLFFNNIITSYLEITNQEDKSRRKKPCLLPAGNSSS